MSLNSNYDLCVEYARSGRAKCRGRAKDFSRVARTCWGTIEKGALRLGKTPRDADGDWVATSWIHWDCLSNNDRGLVRSTGPENVIGFNDLRVEDQGRIRESVKTTQEPKRPTLNLPPLPALPAVERKRRRECDPTPSTGRGSSTIRGAAPSDSQLDAGDGSEEEEDMEEGGGDEGELYTTLTTQVVGTKYYTGLVGLGEQVNLVREPTNRYDGNAIKVTNISNIQVGHLPKNVAAKLAPLLDANRVTAEGTMRQSNIGWREHWALRIDVAIYAPSAHRALLEPYLVWATPGQRGFGEQPLSNVPMTGVPGTSLSPKKGARTPKVDPSEASKAAELRGILDGLHSADGRSITFLDQICGQDVLELPVHTSPPSKSSGLLNNDLLKHQLQALRWCIDAENPQLPKSPDDKPVQFWTRQSSQGETYYYNIATKTPTQDIPTLGRGGILADDMGLGKTLTMLSLILATKDREVEGVSKTTLIVCPPSVLSNWTSQIEEHIHPQAGLKVHVYHEGGRNVSASYLAERDVVITTYQVVSAENPSTKKRTQTADDQDFSDEPQAKKRKKNGKGLYSIKFKRIILDEGHVIRNSKTKMAQSVKELQAELRWVATGTPIINNASDLSSLLSFLRVFRPLDDPEYFKRLLTRPLGRRDPAGVELLKALMSSLCLRRTKEMQNKNGEPLVPLPPVTDITVKVSLDKATHEFYDAVERESAARVSEFFLRGADPANMPIGVNVLSMLTRLRQISLDKSLVPQNYLEDLRAAAKLHERHSVAPPAQGLSSEEKKRLQSVLDIAIQDCEECPVCYDVLKEPRITACSHRFCLACITEVINRAAKCPMDRRALSFGDLIEPSPDIEGASGDDDGDSTEGATEAPPAKIEQLIHLLKLQPKDDKSLVFSQFTSYLRKIAHHLRAAGIPFIQFDGSMSARKRKQVIEAFSNPLSDESETEPDSDSDDEEVQKQNARGNSKGKGRAKVVPENPVVMLISLKSGSVGINLTAANNVFLMDPWWQESIENQAIDRVNRIGQKKSVSVFRLIAEGTVEEKVLDIQARKSDLINQAFSGTKGVENQKQKKEARLAELIELFSVKGVPTA